MTQFEFYKSFWFVTELLLAQAMFVFRFKRRKRFWVLLPVAVGLCYLFAWLLPAASENPFYVSFLFLLIFLFTVLMNKVIFDESWLTVAFSCVAGYTTQHLAYELYNLILVALEYPEASGFYDTSAFAGMFPNLLVAVIYVSSYAPAYFVFYMLFSTRLRDREPIKLKSVFLFVVAVSVLLVDIVLNAVVVKTSVVGAKSLIIVISVYNILCCFFSMFLQFEVSLSKKLEDTLGNVEQMWHRASKQYEMSKENIELINLKCHDLKHQIHKLRSGSDISSQELMEIEEQISIYDSSVKTGNDALDLILTEKSLLCNKSGIIINIMAEGEGLNFMSKEDIYSLFGNILDNAIEAVKNVDDEKRTIMLNIKAAGEMLVIRESNYFADSIEFEDELPVTRGDKRYHGFGMKSIKYVCDRYGGDLTVKAENNVFTLNILFLQNGVGN
ncbi:MAG: sensor histidine kinase [Clostridiales bacterium]|nr:sensor histidine kinase [Clostridiales bacterium]